MLRTADSIIIIFSIVQTGHSLLDKNESLSLG